MQWAPAKCRLCGKPANCRYVTPDGIAMLCADHGRMLQAVRARRKALGWTLAASIELTIAESFRVEPPYLQAPPGS